MAVCRNGLCAGQRARPAAGRHARASRSARGRRGRDSTRTADSEDRRGPEHRSPSARRGCGPAGSARREGLEGGHQDQCPRPRRRRSHFHQRPPFRGPTERRRSHHHGDDQGGACGGAPERAGGLAEARDKRRGQGAKPGGEGIDSRGPQCPVNARESHASGRRHDGARRPFAPLLSRLGEIQRRKAEFT